MYRICILCFAFLSPVRYHMTMVIGFILLVVSLFARRRFSHVAYKSSRTSQVVLPSRRYIYSSATGYYTIASCLLLTSWERICAAVYSVDSMATLKPTKTRRIMLRCNTCSVLIFANGAYSQQRIIDIVGFQIYTSCVI